MRTRFWENEYQTISSSTQNLANKIDQKKQTAGVVPRPFMFCGLPPIIHRSFLVSLGGDNGRCHFN